DGDLYINSGAYILYSIDNGYSFDTILSPIGTFPELPYTMRVLDNDILFLYGDFFGDAFYTLNNGKDWIPTHVLLFGFEPPSIKLVDNYILVADFDPSYSITKINLGTNESTSVDLGSFIDFSYIGSVIQDDGTIYFQAFDLSGGHPDGLYRYRFGEQLEFLGEFAEPTGILGMMTSGNDLYFIGSNQYHLFNGVSFEAYSFSGLPGSVNKSFFISENEHVYAILDKHRIFRSTRPLSYPQTIAGLIHHDTNEDCDLDSLEGTLKNWKIKIEGEEYLKITTSDSEGKYHVSVPKGEYTVSSQPINGNWDLCEYSYPISISENDPNINVDFLAFGLVDCSDLEIDFSTPLLRRCFDNYYSIRVLNNGPEASAGTTLTLELDPYFDFISATIPYTQLNDSIIQFDLGVLQVNEEISFRVIFNLSCDAGLGIEHCLTGDLKDDNECVNSRSFYTECQENIGSVDPNDKRIFNEAGQEVAIVDKGEFIYYHIRFQNTGTDTAFNVKVVDLLSSTLDLNTIEVLSASHPYTFEINDGPALVVNFKNILLPDSTINEPASHGFFKFRIKPLPEFDYGTSIPNQAGIYFDYNDAVNTNEATLVIQNPDGTKEAIDLIDFNIYPNPVTNTLSLDIPERDLNRIDGFEIVDQLGQTLYQSRYSNNNVINVAYLTPGVYSLVLKENGINIGTMKFVKL
ncbi:MAG TPA: T9SS type A sorting domain-containing protein, partial [Saprospiraceae bacterium]|nr:T9SS type A sorting domain-containing protein [Saprospiraceae bacterium]